MLFFIVIGFFLCFFNVVQYCAALNRHRVITFQELGGPDQRTVDLSRMRVRSHTPVPSFFLLA